MRSIGQWRLHDPRTHQVDTSIHYAEAAEITLDSVGDLVAQSEIDAAVRAASKDVVCCNSKVAHVIFHFRC